MSKEIRLPYSEYVEMEDTISRLNKSLRLAINHEGNMVIDKRHVRIQDSRRQIEIPEISAPANELSAFYKDSFDNAFERITQTERELNEAKDSLILERKRYQDKTAEEHVKYTWSIRVACVVLFFIGLVIGLYS